MPDLHELLARVEGAGPDRKLDRELMELDHAVQLRAGMTRWVHIRTGSWGPPVGAEPSFTASVDAALALAERVLPGCLWEAGCAVPPGHWARLYRDPLEMGPAATGATAALALLSALLRALIAQEQKESAG